ncbi:restriction endonuclease [Paenibacillus sp. GSMTC-2017]|uniref:restriction endonuclease n=1 Tax=Paenibacillus sp. GSMTC-2017 TaxID=2794350 RepID=UPI0018D67009|nr:restriction endonuclease [Paenibacillus sp. GSMTC-2017]MBH5319372.1 restriction endonuclease [Paenibacillus sp. GSMTC-2017]
MPVPNYQVIMLPLLRFSSDEMEHSLRESVDFLAEYFQLTEDERQEMLPSGKQTLFQNRVAWASTYLRKSLLLEATKRGSFKITERGAAVVKQNPTEINVRFLMQFQEFIDFLSHKKDNNDDSENDLIVRENSINDEKTPEEALEYSYQRIRNELAVELLNRTKCCSPSFFEKLVVELLVKMGYGGSLKDAGKSVGKTRDGGIDGIIKEDRLGLDIIYIQAKRWEGTVGRPEIQKFAGALQGHRAKKGVFITTSSYSKDAAEYVSLIDSKIVLIDGVTLANLMIDYNLGVSKFALYEVKKVDSDYFIDE